MDAMTGNVALPKLGQEVAALAQPDRILWCDGTDDERHRIAAAGTLVEFDTAKRPNSFWARTDPSRRG